ncbi:hypothetical protein GQ600_16441 [Phytophthora cactorum]|nr:hypothetical protein GQ600_16441 [Phytophthora cactorum]
MAQQYAQMNPMAQQQQQQRFANGGMPYGVPGSGAMAHSVRMSNAMPIPTSYADNRGAMAPNMGFQMGPQGYGMMPPAQMQRMNPATQGMPQQSMAQQGMQQQSMPHQSMTMPQQSMGMSQQSMAMPQQSMTMPQQSMTSREYGDVATKHVYGPTGHDPAEYADAPAGHESDADERTSELGPMANASVQSSN